MDKIITIGDSCIGAIAVIDIETKEPAAMVRDYIIQEGFLLFVLDIVNSELHDTLSEEDVSPKYEFLDLVSCHFNLQN
jgi:hypothetical protein